MDATRLTYSALAVQKGHGSHTCDLLGGLIPLGGLSAISAADNEPGWGISAADQRAGRSPCVTTRATRSPPRAPRLRVERRRHRVLGAGRDVPPGREQGGVVGVGHVQGA